jgi:hypothetical protein
MADEENFFDQFDAPTAERRSAPRENYFDRFDRQQPENYFDRFDTTQQQQAQPEAESALGTFLRGAKETGIAGAGAYAAGQVGARLAGRYLGAALGSFAGPVGTVGGMLAGGYAAERALSALGFDDSHQRAVNAKEHPYAAIAGETAGILPIFGPGGIARAGAGLVERATPRVVGGVAMGGLEGARQAYEGEFDPLRLAAQTATGAVLVKPTALARSIEARVGGAMERAGFPAEGRPETAAAREAVQPAEQPAAPKVSVGTSEEAVNPQERKVGDAQNAAVRSQRDYPAAEPTPQEDVRTGFPKEFPAEPTPEWTGTRDGTLPDYGARLEREFPRVRPAEEGVNIARPDEPVADPSLRAALGGQEAMPAEDLAMLQGAPRAAAAPVETPATIRARAKARAGFTPFDVEKLPDAYLKELVQRQDIPQFRRDLFAAELQARRLETAEPELPPGLQAPYPAVQAMARRVRERGRPTRTEPLRPVTPEAVMGAAEQRAAEQGRTLAPAEAMPTPTGGGPPERGLPPGAQPPLGPGERPPSALEPATPSDLQQGLLASLRRTFMPMLSESARKAGAAIRGAYGPLARVREQTATRFTNDMHQLANKMDEPAFNKFVDAYETGRTGTLPPEQKPLAKTLEQGYGDFWKEIKKLPEADKMEATKDFLTHMYDNSNGQVDKFTRDFYGAGGGSLRARTHPTFADARAAGLKPLSNNPIEYFARYSESMSNHLAQRRMIADLEGQDRIGYFKPKIVGASGTPEPSVRGGPPEGYAEIKMPWAQKNGKQAYAPRDIAETLNQFYDAGLRRSQTKDIYEFLQQTKNMWTAVELGLSAYHATTMGVESIASGMARAMQIAATGDFARATKQLLTAPAEPFTLYRHGREMRQIYRDPTGTLGTPRQREMLDILAKANIQPGNLAATREYDMSKLGNFWDAHKRGSLMNEFNAQLKEISDSSGLKLPKVLLDNVRRGVQTLSKPLFEHYIPELKLGTMMKDLETWLHYNPNATSEQATAAARRISDSIDNRMGEMNMNNLFMNRTAKDLGTLTLRSFGFTVGGPGREIGAGLGAIGKRAAQGKSPFALSLRGEHDPRTAYAMAFLPTIAAISAVYQYMRTGEGPTDWRDLATPKTGGTVKSVGQQVPERILVPGYHKDFLGYFVNPSGPLHELQAKLAAPWTALMEQFTGKDWRDKPYVPPRATTLEWLAAHGKALASHMLPIGPKQLAEGTKPGSALTLLEQTLGVRTPGAYMLNPKGLEGYLTKQQQRDWTAKEKQENRARRERGEPSVPTRQLPPSGYARGGPVLQKIGQRRYQEGSRAASQ